MKLAKVVDVRDARAPITCDPWLTNPAQRMRAEELLRRYPDTTKEEAAEIRMFLTKGRHYDVEHEPANANQASRAVPHSIHPAQRGVLGTYRAPAWSTTKPASR